MTAKGFLLQALNRNIRVLSREKMNRLIIMKILRFRKRKEKGKKNEMKNTRSLYSRSA